MKLKLPFTLIMAHCLLSACSALDRNAMATELAVQHESLAKHFEDEASEMQLKVDEHKKFLSHFESKRYVYGRHADDLKAHSQQIIRIYEQAVAANREMARLIEENGH